MHRVPHESKMVPKKSTRIPKPKGSSRKTPTSYRAPPVGTWRIDDWSGLYGRYIEELALFPVDALTPTEFEVENNYEGRGDDSLRYAKWMEQGHIPPPISVVQADNGELRITDGHRRWWAHKRLGIPVRAWVSWSVPGDHVDHKGHPIQTGLTYELAEKQGMVQKRNNPAPGRVKLPASVVKGLKRGLDLHKKGKGGKGLVSETIKLAREGVSRGSWPDWKVVKASNWFARHVADRRRMTNPRAWNKAPNYSPAYVAWTLWGDDGSGAGRRWIDKKAKELRSKGVKASPRKNPPRTQAYKYGVPAKYLKGLSDKVARQRAAEIIRRRERGIKTDKPLPGDRQARSKPMRGSKWTRAYHKKYGTGAGSSLRKIAKETGFSERVIREVYKRGVGASRTAGRRPGATDSSWALARVHAFVMKAKHKMAKLNHDTDLIRKNPPMTSRHPMLLRHIVRGMFVQGSDPTATKTKAEIKKLVAMYGKYDLDPREELNLAFGTATNSLVNSGKIRKSKDGRRWVLTEKGKRASAKKRRDQSSAQMNRKDQQYEWILEFTRQAKR